MQRAYISKLMELAEKDPNILHLVADSGTGFDEMFRRNFPKQMYNFGICEEHMVAAAAGMATAGKIPFIFTAGAFLAYRSLEFIRDDLCFQNLNAKVIGMGSGLAWSTLGPSHHTTEDIAVLRAIPNLMILSPATPRQAAACVEAAYEHQGPVYIRIGMNHEKELFEEGYTLPGNKIEILEEGSTVAVFVTGSIIEEVQMAVKQLKSSGISASLINVHTLKPFDRDSILDMSRKFKIFVTVEEHNQLGGLGSIISEVLTDVGIPIKLKRIGLTDMFALGYGTHQNVRKENGLDSENIYRKIMESL